MKHFAGRTDKRHWAWSSSRAISRLDQGTLHRQKGAPRTDTVKRYVRKDGSTGYVGTRKLKQTETLGHVSRSCWCTSGDHRQYSFFGAVYRCMWYLSHSEINTQTLQERDRDICWVIFWGVQLSLKTEAVVSQAVLHKQVQSFWGILLVN